MEMRRNGLLLLLCAPLWGGPESGAAAFEEGLRVVGGLLERGQCAEGRKRLKALLEEHARATYVLGRRVQLEELTRQLAFGATVGEPNPKDLVSGELLSYSARDGTIKIRYRGGDDMKDWIRVGTTMFHPAAFRGPHSITIKGDRYPDRSTGVVVVCRTDEKSIAVVPGLAPANGPGGAHGGIPPRIDLRSGEKEQQIGGGADSPVAGGRAFTVSIVVNATQISCFYGGKAIARAAKRADHWGGLAFAFFGEEVVISGKVEPAWIQGLVDKERQARLAEFDKRWQPKDDLPEWLFAAAPAAALPEPDARDWPAEMDAAAAATVTRVIELHGAGEALAALRLVDGSDSLPGPVRDYLRGWLLHDLGRHEEAAGACRKVREADRDFWPAVAGEARALAALGRVEEAVALYRDLLERFPGGADLHAEAALFLGGAGRWDEADRVVAAALSKGVRSEPLDAASRIVHKAVRGPAWPRRHDYESTHYLVLSDMDPKVCFEASQILEQAFAVFINRLERAPPSKERFKVFLFSGRAGYQDYILGLLGTTAPHTAGLYAPALRQLFIWNLPEREDMMRTVRHEGFHQYLHRIMDDPPLWFNEGLAEYFEEAKIVRGEWTTGAPRQDHLETLGGRTKPLDRFLFLDDAAFMREAGPNYAQAWAFIHFLFHSTRENRQLFDRFWDSFKAIPAHADAIRAAMGDRTIGRLQVGFEAHLSSLSR
jgi:tetratricopeptide (TPR) repeat protein